jgi:septal ring factor EnvC (AmiA/AmiB activator)
MKSVRALLLGCSACLLASVAVAEVGFEVYSDSLQAVDAQLAAHQRKLGEHRTRKAEASETLATIGPNTQAMRERLQRDARALYRVSRGGMLPLAGGISALLGHASRVGRLSHIVERELASLSEFGKRQAALQKQIAALDQQIAADERELASLQLARAGTLRERAAHASFQAALSAARAPAERSDDSGGFDSSGRVQYGLSVIGGSTPERFSDQRGNLALPISGPSSIQDATRAESDGPGLEIAASSGAAVRAAASGRVTFSDSFGSYGRLVIIQHGDRYSSVYGGLAQIDVQVGDELSKSARVGSVGSSPLYFEVRRGTKTQDARAWLGL